MKPDYNAILGQKTYRKGFSGIDYNDIDTVTTRYNMLVATGHKDDKDTGGNALRSEWAKKRLNVDLGSLPDFLKPPRINLSQLPFGSFFIRFTFKLRKPYISRDENQFYIIDNPIVRDKVFGFPMVRPTAWKGSLSHALWQKEYDENNEQIQRLFGWANDEEVDGKRGRLYFYPTFFDQIGLEVINPHDRKSGAGTHPIYFECVPIGATGTFTLLYTPLDRIGEEENVTKQQVFADLQLVTEGLKTMFTVYGFGAKTSSGFGVAEDKLPKNGQLKINYPSPSDSITLPPFDSLSFLTGQAKALKKQIAEV